MKPEVRRALAREWLILMAVAIVMTLCRAGWLYCKNKELEHNEYVAKEVSENAARTELKLKEDHKKMQRDDLERVLQNAKEGLSDQAHVDRVLREMSKEDESYGVVLYRELKEEYQKKLQGAQRELLVYPSPATSKGVISAATWAVAWSWLAYLGLWAPRLTVGSIRLLRNSANKRDQP